MTNGAPEYPSTVASSRIVATMARANIRNPFVRCAFMPATEWQEFLLHIFTFTISPSSCLETLARHVRENILDNPPLSIQRNNVTPNFSPVRSWLLASFFEIGGNWTKLFFLFTKIIQFLGNCFFIITYYFVKNMAEYIRKITLFVLRINLTSQLLREIPARWI